MLVARLKECINHVFSGITLLSQYQSFMRVSIFMHLVDHSSNITFLIESKLLARKRECMNEAIQALLGARKNGVGTDSTEEICFLGLTSFLDGLGE